jgi:hypothetical protein
VEHLRKPSKCPWRIVLAPLLVLLAGQSLWTIWLLFQAYQDGYHHCQYSQSVWPRHNVYESKDLVFMFKVNAYYLE